MSWPTILGVVLLIYAGFVIYRGRLTSGDDYGNTSVIDRAKTPIRFWISVSVLVLLALALVFNVFHF